MFLLLFLLLGRNEIDRVRKKSVLDSKDFLIVIENGISSINVNKPRVTFNDAEEFEQAIEFLVSAKYIKIIIDFTNCNYVDSVLIGIMVNCLRGVRKKGGDILVVLSQGALNVLFFV
jgi:anti-anti-sigma regulatory factor